LKGFSDIAFLILCEWFFSFNPTQSTTIITPENWTTVISQLPIGGLTRQLAHNTVIEKFESDVLHLALSPQHAALLTTGQEGKFGKGVSEYLGRSVMVKIRLAEAEQATATPANQLAEAKQSQQSAAVNTLQQDPQFQSLVNTFDATLDPNTATQDLEKHHGHE